MGERTNREGLTWDEWAAAAALPTERIYRKNLFFDRDGYPPRKYPKQRRAWREGEDPTEWRAEKCRERA